MPAPRLLPPPSWLYLRKTLQLAKPEGDWKAIADGPEPEAAKVEALRQWVKAKLKVDPATSPDYDPQGRANSWGDGWRTWNRFDLPPSKIRAELPGWGLTHAVTGKVTIKSFLESVLDGGGQVTPTMERMRVGVLVKTGMSPEADQTTGGANYFFTRIADPARANSRRGMVFKIDLLSRADAYAFAGDRYGDVRPAQESSRSDPQKARGRTLADFKRFAKNPGNETIFKNGLSLLDDIEVFGEDQASEHHLDFGRVEDDGYYLNFYGEDGKILATLSPIEDDEEREVWNRWQDFLASPEGRGAVESINWLRDRAINWEA